MRRQSAKRQKRNAEWGPVRRDFCIEMGVCAKCSRQAPLDCHEIARGAAREAALSRREAWLALCRNCHDSMDDYSVWPVERQLALKLLSDPAWFNIQVVNELRGRAPDAITLAEVADYLGLRTDWTR
jgi:hypothetical protein